MKKIKSFKDLDVWQVASKLAKDIATKLVSMFPKVEQYRLGDQIIRSSRSVPAQISEGFRKVSLKEKHRYYEIAATSNDESENHLNEAKNNKFIDNRIYQSYTNRVIRVRILLSHLMKSIRFLINRPKGHNRCKATNPASLMSHNRSKRARDVNA
jgi:four helix bundle protein